MLEVGKFQSETYGLRVLYPRACRASSTEQGRAYEAADSFRDCREIRREGIAAEQGSGADFAVHSEFLDANGAPEARESTMRRSSSPMNQDRTVYMYEKTTEIGQGVSFGGGGSTSFPAWNNLASKGEKHPIWAGWKGLRVFP
jgi:hypothetical protein